MIFSFRPSGTVCDGALEGAVVDELTIERAGTVLTALHRPGTGAALVIVAGVMADAAGWVPVAEAIGTDRPVLVLNRRGRLPSGPLGDTYDVDTEVADLLAWLDHVDGPATVLGWSYGALIALETAARTDLIDHVVAYEPVTAPFGAEAVEPLRQAVAEGDLDRAVTILNRTVSGFPASQVDALRASPAWAGLLPLVAPVPQELRALNAFAPGGWSAVRCPVTLVLGAVNRGRAPYGTAFDRVAALLPRARVVELVGQGHLAHVDAPDELGRLVGDLVAT